MQSDLRLAVVTLYCLCTFTIIGSFSVYRFSIGDWLIGTVDAVIVTVFLALMALAWRPGWTRFAAHLTTLAASLAGMTAVLVLDLSFMWVFGILVSNFLMADRRVALTASAVVVASIAFYPAAFATPTDHATFVAVATMVSVFSLIFSTRVDTQHSQLTQLAARDGLTGAFNRRSLDHDLQALVDGTKGTDQRLSLALIDLDNFKQFNDEHGHDLGDRILVDLTKIVESNTREKDRFYRYGGEEFVLLMPRTGLSGAEVSLGNLRGQIADRLECPGGRVTISAGMAEHLAGESADAWLSRADQALLRAKRAGKNRVEVG